MAARPHASAGCTQANSKVSIHARPRMAARRRCGSRSSRRTTFQSTRDHEWPRDQPPGASPATTRSFNPRATTNGRATSCALLERRPQRRFQSTRDHEWPRDRSSVAPRAALRGVSIHARPRMAARPGVVTHVGCVHAFQSTRDHEWPRDDVSTLISELTPWFQSTRDHEWPRDLPFCEHVARGFRFNPRATTNGRATPRRACELADSTMFQSTRDHEWPRDASRISR